MCGTTFKSDNSLTTNDTNRSGHVVLTVSFRMLLNFVPIKLSSFFFLLWNVADCLLISQTTSSQLAILPCVAFPWEKLKKTCEIMRQGAKTRVRRNLTRDTSKDMEESVCQAPGMRGCCTPGKFSGGVPPDFFF